MSSTRNLHTTDDSPRARSERHRARKISEGEWLREVHSALGLLMLDLSADEQRAMARELAEPGTELQQLMWHAADNSRGHRTPAWDVAGRIYHVMISRRYATAAAPAQQAERPEWDLY